MTKSQDEKELSCNYLVNAAGPWGAKLALMAGVGEEAQEDPVLRVPLPVSPRKRCVFVFKCPSGPTRDSLLIADYTGPFVRREGGGSTFIAGMCPPKVRRSPGRVSVMSPPPQTYPISQIWRVSISEGS